jgi:hypothetical protein
VGVLVTAGDNQDAVHTIKRQLQRLLPGIRAFLDTDDLEDLASLEHHVCSSAAVLIYLGSTAYFSSPNCLREVCAAKARPLVRVWDAARGVSLESLRVACPDVHRHDVFDGSQLVQWCRVRDFQLVALAQICELLLCACEKTSEPCELYVCNALPWAPLYFHAPIAVYASPNNPEAAPILARLCERFEDVRSAATLDESHRLLVCLSVGCFEGEGGAALAREIEVAFRLGSSVVLVYEPDNGAFGGIIQATPSALIQLKLYDILAIDWWRGPLQRASEQLVARALGGIVERACWSTLPHRLLRRDAAASRGWMRTRSGLFIEPGEALMRRQQSLMLRLPQSVRSNREVSVAEHGVRTDGLDVQEQL